MNIVITVNAAWNIWNFRMPLLAQLLDQGHAVTILAPEDEAAGKLKDLGCSFRHLEMSAKGLSPFEGLSLIRQFDKAFRDIEPDVVLSFTIKNNIFGAFAAKLQRRPFLPNITGLGTAFLSSGLLERAAVALYKNAFRGLPVVFFQNEDDHRLFVERNLVSPGQAQIVPGSGIDLEHFAPAPYPEGAGETVFLMIARLLKDKGVYEYVDAARQVRKEYPDARFQLLGPAGSLNRTAIGEDEVQDWVREGHVEYLGATDDVRDQIARSHCIVLPSYREGAPRTLIEGAAMARPVITTDVPGCRAVVDHGSSGFYCEPRCAVSLAESIRQFLQLSAAERAAMGQAGRDKMEREFCHSIVNRAYSKALDQLTARKITAA